MNCLWSGKLHKVQWEDQNMEASFFLFIFYSANQLCQLCGKWLKMDTRAVFYLQHCLLSLPGTKNPASTGSDEFYMCSGFGLNIKRTGHGQQSPPPPRDNNNIKGWKKEEKSEGKTSRCPHTLTDSWSLGSAAQTLCRSDVGQTQRQISWNKKTPSPTTSRWSWPAKPRSKTMTAAGVMRKEKAVCCIYSGDSVSATSVTSKPTTVRALWWRIVYWSGSLCLCEWFDIHAAFTSLWWEGKLLFLAHSLLALCVCVCVYSTCTRLGLLGGCTCNAALLLCWSQLKGCS